LKTHCGSRKSPLAFNLKALGIFFQFYANADGLIDRDALIPVLDENSHQVSQLILFSASESPAKIRRMPTTESPLILHCHPATPAPVVRTIEAQIGWKTDGALVITYCLWGDMARLLVAPQQLPERSDFLWEHTCFEAFVGIPDQTAYREFNFSPSGHWAAYAFSNYRRRIESFPLDRVPQIETQRFAGRLELSATLPFGALPSGSTMFQIGLSAVIEAADIVAGAHSYWALHHPSARPDFHHRAAFTMQLALPRISA